MTNFERVKDYYKNFDEKNRLSGSSHGRLEYMMTMDILKEHLPKGGTILDLGGGAGAYAFPLAAEGYKVVLADLSPDLIEQAKQEKAETGADNLIACDVVNATDLNMYGDVQFDAVLLLGPLYHLIEESERKQCVSEVYRVLKPGGTVIASFIPYLTGSIAIVDRFFRDPRQVNRANLEEVFRSGKFNNMAPWGFQEGYYPSSDEIDELFKNCGFSKKLIRSLRSFGYGREEMLCSLAEKDPEMFNIIIGLINQTAEDKAIIETCCHAVYIGTRHKQAFGEIA